MGKGSFARTEFVASQISNGIAIQIRALRNREKLSQPKLAELVGTTQNQIYRLENPATSKPTITTLKKLAAAFDVALVVRFEPFSKLINWVSANEYREVGLSSHAIAVPNFTQEFSLALGTVSDSAIGASDYATSQLNPKNSGGIPEGAEGEMNRRETRPAA